MPMSLAEARTLIIDEMAGSGDRSSGWDGRMTAAILVTFGDGSAKAGRERLVKLAAEKIEGERSSR